MDSNNIKQPDEESELTPEYRELLSKQRTTIDNYRTLIEQLVHTTKKNIIDLNIYMLKQGMLNRFHPTLSNRFHWVMIRTCGYAVRIFACVFILGTVIQSFLQNILSAKTFYAFLFGLACLYIGDKIIDPYISNKILPRIRQNLICTYVEMNNWYFVKEKTLLNLFYEIPKISQQLTKLYK